MPKERNIVIGEVQPGTVESCLSDFETLSSSSEFKFEVVSYSDLENFQKAFASKLSLDSLYGSPPCRFSYSRESALIECRYMTSRLDSSFQDEQFRPAYIFTPNEMFYYDGQSLSEILIDSIKLANLEEILEITPAYKGKASKVLSEAQLHNITDISGHNPFISEVWKDINSGTNFLTCIWLPEDENPSWIFIDVNEKKFIVLRKGDTILDICKILDNLQYKSQQIESREIDEYLFQELKNKIKGQEEIQLSSEERELATYIVMLQVVYEEISKYYFVIDGERRKLSLFDKECSNLATYIAESVTWENEEFERFVVTAMRLLCGRDQSPRSSCTPPTPRSKLDDQSPRLPYAPCARPQSAPQSGNGRGDDAISPRKESCPQSPLRLGSLFIPVDSGPQGGDGREDDAIPPIKELCPKNPSRQETIPVDSGVPSVWQKFKLRVKINYENWRALSLVYKIAFFMAIAIGIGAIVYGCVFCPPVAILIPLVGLLNAPAIAVIGGVVVASIALVSHAFHVAFTEVNNSKVDKKENCGTSRYTEGMVASSSVTPLSAPNSRNSQPFADGVSSAILAEKLLEAAAEAKSQEAACVNAVPPVAPGSGAEDKAGIADCSLASTPIIIGLGVVAAPIGQPLEVVAEAKSQEAACVNAVPPVAPGSGAEDKAGIADCSLASTPIIIGRGVVAVSTDRPSGELPRNALPGFFSSTQNASVSPVMKSRKQPPPPVQIPEQDPERSRVVYLSPTPIIRRDEGEMVPPNLSL